MAIKSEPIPVYDTAKLRNPAIEEIFEVFRYRHLILQIIRRDVITRYKRSILGIAWSMLSPLGMMIVMTVVFSTVFGRDPGYRAYLLSGLLAWSFFSESTNLIMGKLVWGSGLFKRIYVPLTAFAISAVGTGMVNLVLAILPLLLVMVFVNVPLTTALFFLPVPILLLLLFSLGLGLLISVLAMYFPDVREMYKVALRAWMYLTPIIYPETLLSDNGYGWLLTINPMRYLINIFRFPVQEGRIPTMEEFLPGFLIAVGVFAVGWIFFSRHSDEFAYRV